MSKARRIGFLVNPAITFDRAVARGAAAFARQRPAWTCAIIGAGAGADQALRDMDAIDLHGLVACCRLPEDLHNTVQRGLAVVHVSRAAAPWAQVACDDALVGQLAADHLASLGLRNFAFGPPAAWTPPQEAFRRRLGELGLDSPGAAVSPDAAWLAQAPKPLGFFALGDDSAAAVIRHCRLAAIPVPQSVAVLGVGNDEIICELYGLSSIALAGHRVGYEAARRLDESLHGRQSPPVLIPPAGVAQRASTDICFLPDPHVAHAVRFIRHHAQEHLKVTDVLRQLTISRRSLEQRFLRTLGRSPADEIRRARVEVAKQTLAESDQSMDYVARAAGFNDAKQLDSTFHRQTGMTPTRFRRLYRRP